VIGDPATMHRCLRRSDLLAGALLVAALTAAAPAAAQSPAPPRAATAPPALPAPGQKLSLPEAVALALRLNPILRSAQQTQVAAQTRVPQAQSAYYPRVDWLTGASRARTYSPSSDRYSTGNSVSTALAGSQLIYDFGKTGALVDEARAGVRASDAEAERTREVVVFTVRQTYFGVLQARRLVRVADAQVQRADLNLRSARGFFEVGTRAKSDVSRAEVDAANARVDQIRARNLVRIAETNFANALGLEANTQLDIEDILTYEPVVLDQAALLSDALANRPELEQAKARLDAARAQLAGAKAGYLPDLAAVGVVGSSSDNLEPHDTWSVGITLSWNLFQGFFTVNKVKETQALVEVARANYDALELQVRLDVQQAYIVVSEAGERIGATEVAVESARENLRLAQGRYDAGVGTILDLTEAQLSLTQAEADLVRALTDYRVGLAALDRAVGRP
jgi:outer membrane protein